MAKLAAIKLTGASKATYMFNVYPRLDTFKAIGAVYFMTKRTAKADGNGNHTWVYVGETGDLSGRPLNHHRKACFDHHGANAVLVHAESDQKKRLAIESDLREAYDPPCNQQ